MTPMERLAVAQSRLHWAYADESRLPTPMKKISPSIGE